MKNHAHGLTASLRLKETSDEEKLKIIRDSVALLKPILEDLLPLYQSQISKPLTRAEFESRSFEVLTYQGSLD